LGDRVAIGRDDLRPVLEYVLMSYSPADRPSALASAPTHDEPHYLEHQQIVIVLSGLMAGVLSARA
jgi:hypothetical protein